MNDLERHAKPYSKAIVRLLKGVVERKHTAIWEDITVHYQHDIQEYVNLIGLELIVKKDEGFAFLKQMEDSEGNTLGLVTRRRIGFEASIILVVLRQALEEFDSNPAQIHATERFITDIEIKNELELFLQEGYNRLKFERDLDKYIRQVADLGYLKEISKNDNETQYQIHRIIKEKVTLDALREFKEQL